MAQITVVAKVNNQDGDGVGGSNVGVEVDGICKFKVVAGKNQICWKVRWSPEKNPKYNIYIPLKNHISADMIMSVPTCFEHHLNKRKKEKKEKKREAYATERWSSFQGSQKWLKVSIEKLLLLDMLKM